MSELCDSKFVHHSFDNEKDVSLRHLYRSLWNHVTLGQWELARVCLERLYSARQLLKKSLKDALRAVIDRPMLAGKGSPSVSSPLHLSWLCLVDYLKLFVSQEDKLPSQISLTVEFHLLLYLNNCKSAPEQVLQELDDYYSKIVYGDTSIFKDDILSSHAIQFLRNLLDQDPEFGHALISQLIVKTKHFLENNQTLQQLYVNCTKQLQEMLANDGSTGQSPTSLCPRTIEDTKDQLYKLLSFMNPTADMIALISSLESLFKNLIQQCKLTGISQLQTGALYSSLLQRPTSFLLQSFCQVENKLLFSCDELLEDGEVFGGKYPLLSQAACVCLAQCNITKRTEALKFLFFHALNRNHILENIVETALLLIKDGDFAKVTQLLLEFKVLKPLILLLGWPYCYSCENARNLLDTLWDQKAPIEHPLFYQTCEKLAYQVQLVQWCLDKAGLLLASSEAGSTHHQQASDMFQGLESHSVLRVLHKSISLAQLPEKEVFSLLRKRPVFSSGSDSKDWDEEDISSKTVHPEVERDLILYHSFCAIKSYMDCIFNQECQTVSSPFNDSALLEKLSNGRQHLTNVFPLTYRVEILENIFSLLFVTYQDLYTENTLHESDGLDTGDDDTKSMNTSLTGSMESLTSITSTDTASIDALGHYSPFKEQLNANSPIKVKGHSRSGSHDSKLVSQTTKAMPSLGIIAKEGRSDRSEPTTPTKAKEHSRTASRDSIQAVRGVLNLSTSNIKMAKEGLSDKSEPTTPIKTMKQHSCQQSTIGFIVINKVVPEYLKSLKECLLDINTAKLIERQSGKSSIYSNPDWLYTSVGNNVLEQRISRLSQYIVEAQWRYQLVSWNGDHKSESSPKGRPKFNQQSSSLTQERVHLKMTPGDKQQSERASQTLSNKDSGDTDQCSDESSSYQSQELTTGTEDNALSYKLTKKHSRLPRHNRRPSLTEGFVVRDDSSVARMLSSPETLIFMCLRKDSYDRAQQVIKMFHMHGKQSANAAIFAEKFSVVFKDLSNLQRRTRASPSHLNSSSRTLGAVAMAAASGVSSTVTSHSIDQLLTSSIPSPVVLSDMETSDDVIKKSPLYGYIHPDLIPAMVCLDLACTVNAPMEVCKNLLDTAKSRLQQVEEAVAIKQESCLVGVTNVLCDFYQLLIQDCKTTSTRFLSTQPNVVDFLSGRLPLKIKSRNLSCTHENEQKQSIKRIECALEEGDVSIVAIHEATKRSSKEMKAQESRSFSLVEKVLSVRVALTELQSSFNCTLDHATSGVFTKPDRLDYLRSLLNHVDTIATLLLHWQSNPDDFSGFSKDATGGVLMKASNPFVVLNKGIAETFGKPMFDKNVSPIRLEGICKQLNINLVKVIVDNCCPHITSCGLSSATSFSWPSSRVLILNNGTHWLENARDPNIVAKELLTEMIDLLTDVAKSNNGLVDAFCADFVVSSPRFSSIVQGTNELQRVDLDLLQTSESKFCFFINIFNLLIAHASLLEFSMKREEEPRKPHAHHGSLPYLSGCPSIYGNNSDKQTSISSLDRISFLKHHCYTIGQIGPTSAFDILFMIIRSGMFPPTMFGSAIQLCYPERPADDPKRKYKPPHQDKVSFAISEGCLSSPDLQVYDVEELEYQLHAAAISYVNRYVTIDEEQVVLPELLNWYRDDFTQESVTDIKTNKTTDAITASFLLRFEPYLHDSKAALLRSVLPNIKRITYTPFCWTFGYQFEVSSLDNSESNSTLYRSSSVPDSLQLSLELSGTASVGSIESRGKFHPNHPILEYLSKESSLVSTLVELVCSTNVQNTGNLDQNLSQLSKEFGFNGILKKVSDFPVLQRSIASRFYCFAEFLTMASGEIEISGSYELVGSETKSLGEDHIDLAPNIKFCPLVLSENNSTDLKFAYKRSSDFFLRQGNFCNLLELMRTMDLYGDGSCGEALDYLVVSALLGKGGSNEMFPKRLDAILSDHNLPSVGFTHKWHKKPWSLLAQIKDDNQLAQLVLSHLKEYKAKVGLDLLNLALSHPPNNTALRKELDHRKKEINLHNKIAQCAKAPQLRTTEAMDTTRSPASLTQWQGVAAKTIDDPGQIMEFLMSIQQYELAGSWAELHGLPSEYHKIIKERHLKCLLNSSSEDTMKAYCILEGIQEQHMALDICQSLLHQKLHVSQILFIIQFMLTNLQQHLSPLRMQELLMTKMGAKALLCIPEMARSSYEHLVSRPNLLLEQLLMNLKVEWAAQVFSRLQVDFALMKDTMVEGGSQECTVKSFDTLLSTYAAKALEFQVVQTQLSPEVTLIANEEILSSSPTLSGSHHAPSSTPRREIPSTMKDFRNSLNQSMSLTKEPKIYVPPAIPPSKEEWMTDAQALKCIICEEAFSMFNRRHHCRRCGRVVCGACSRHNCVVQNYGDTPVRVCDSCYTRHEDRTEAVERTNVSASPVHAGSFTKSIGQESVVGSYGTSPYAAEVKAESETSNKWRLSLDSETNIALREEFYFEQAPSSSLCIAILDLHSDHLVCGRLMLDLCNTLSKKLVPITPGLRNDEVDHNLIISMIRHLLFNAKLKMIKVGETGGLELCDTYLSHVELMKFLVESNCGDIPSLQDLTHPDSARRLRDRFIEDERLSLAMEVSTKCGLEPSCVWAASGFACLQAGNLVAARDKFAMCMKSSDGKPHQQQYSQFLDKIIDILQTSALISYSQSTDELLSPLRGMAEHCKNSTHSNILDSRRFDECLYYLHAYGNDLSIVTFYCRHSHLKLACRYILDKKSQPEVFVEGLLMRLISKGSISSLKEQMEAMDPSLQSWTPYLTASCRYLNKRRYHHLLYDLQLFMKDFFRAAQTCIRFFDGTMGSTATSYSDLFSRLDYLGKASSHIEAVIVEKKSSRGSTLSATSWLRSHSNLRRKSSEEMHHTSITLSELTSHVNTINLQIEVTNFLHKCCSEGGYISELRVSNDEKLPTLFGNGHAKAELAIQVLLAGSTIQHGFSLAARIIQDYNLPGPRVYVDAGRKLARQYRFNHIQQLLKCVAEVGLISDKCHDEIILACVRIISTDQNQAKHVENLIKLLKNDSNKIDAFLLCGKLRSAYLIAVKEKNLEAVQMIAEEAQKTGQTKTLSLCKKWLAQNQNVTETEERGAAYQAGSRK